MGREIGPLLDDSNHSSTVKFAHLFMVLSVVERKSSSCNVKSVKILEETLSSFKFDPIFRNGMFCSLRTILERSVVSDHCVWVK